MTDLPTRNLQKEFIYGITVMQTDCDMFKHAGYSNYIRWQSLTIDAFFLSHEKLKDFLLRGNRLKIDYVDMNYRRGVVYGDKLCIKLNTSNIKEADITFFFTFSLENTGVLVGSGKQKVRFENSKGELVLKLSEEITQLLHSIEVNSDDLLKYE